VSPRSRNFITALTVMIAGAALWGPAFADDGKLLATGGISQIEGAGGSGLVPWALINGYETRDGIAVTVHETYVPLHDFTLRAPGIAVGLYDRVELSYAANGLVIDNENLAPGGLHKGRTLHQDVFGAKVRVAGDAVYAQDSWLPQVAIGVLAKRSSDPEVLKAVGAKDRTGADFYVAATKLILSYSLLVSGSVRFTRANQYGLLGFGGSRGGDYQPEFEGALAYLISKRFAVGIDYRRKPDNLAKFAGVLPIAPESDAFDIFAAYFFNKTLSLTAAYVDLGSIANVSLAPLGIARGLEPHTQNGVFLSLQLAF
jgi:hypothetical protein